jgi:hypothetical protein
MERENIDTTTHLLPPPPPPPLRTPNPARATFLTIFVQLFLFVSTPQHLHSVPFLPRSRRYAEWLKRPRQSGALSPRAGFTLET